MHKTKIRVSSVTNAVRGVKLLNSYGISAYYKRTTNPALNEGCGYSIYVDYGDKEESVNLLRENEIKISGVD